jgi:hypothetical protein
MVMTGILPRTVSQEIIVRVECLAKVFIFNFPAKHQIRKTQQMESTQSQPSHFFIAFVQACPLAISVHKTTTLNGIDEQYMKENRGSVRSTQINEHDLKYGGLWRGRQPLVPLIRRMMFDIPMKIHLSYD